MIPAPGDIESRKKFAEFLSTHYTIDLDNNRHVFLDTKSHIIYYSTKLSDHFAWWQTDRKKDAPFVDWVLSVDEIIAIDTVSSCGDSTTTSVRLDRRGGSVAYNESFLSEEMHSVTTPNGAKYVSVMTYTLPAKGAADDSRSIQKLYRSDVG